MHNDIRLLKVYCRQADTAKAKRAEVVDHALRILRSGLVTAAGYDARGNLLADTTWSPFGDARNAVTSYAWDTTWDAVTRVISPMKVVTEMGYDAATGSVVWQQTGGPAHRVGFAYYPLTSGITAGLALSSTAPNGQPDEYRYDQTSVKSVVRIVSDCRCRRVVRL